MSSTQLVGLAVNEPYPFALPGAEGASADFLRPGANRLLITMPNISEVEAKALHRGELRAGLLQKGGALLFLWQFSDKKGPLFTLDSLFDARIIPDIQLYDVTTAQTRLAIEVHIVDSATNLVRGLRIVTMPPGLTLAFLSAVQEQLSMPQNPSVVAQWMAVPPPTLTKTTQMWLMGK